MITLDLTTIELEKLITHHIGNKLRDEKCFFSDTFTSIDSETKRVLLKYFLLTIKTDEYYSFTHPIELESNDIYSVVKKIFTNNIDFVLGSQQIAKLLYEYSLHPKIKEGELNITLFSNIIFDNEVVDAIGIFKSETGVPFIKMINDKTNFIINHDYGFEIKGMDKGCIIFNNKQNEGYKILILDNATKSTEAKYWKDDFLKVKPIENEFRQTNQFLSITKNFVTKHISTEFQLSNADKIDLLNRSVEYFKTHDTFEKNDFENEVFQNTQVLESFKRYNNTFREENDIELVDNFYISPNAVKKQTRIFKKVLKLDKNFHIYIHGNRELIEQGIDDNGRKFYKIYYENEM